MIACIDGDRRQTVTVGLTVVRVTIRAAGSHLLHDDVRRRDL
jgi:hypothetical protein